jgi:hypothetical protein
VILCDRNEAISLKEKAFPKPLIDSLYRFKITYRACGKVDGLRRPTFHTRPDNWFFSLNRKMKEGEAVND